MTRLFPVSLRITAASLLILTVFLLFVAGCLQPAPEQQKTPAPVTVSQTDNNHLLITYTGSTETTTLLELEVTVTDAAGNPQTKSIGDRFSTTPLKFGATLPLAGTFSGKDHVIVTGYFMDSSKRVVLDTIV